MAKEQQKKKTSGRLGMRRFIIVAISISLILYFANGPTIQKDEQGNEFIQKVVKTQELSLDQFLQATNSNEYEFIKVINETTLEGYKPTDEKESSSFPSMATLQKNIDIKYYTVDKSQKPALTSLTDLGIPLAGSVKIIVSSEESGMFTKMLIEQVLPTLFFVALLIFFFKMMMPKGGAGGLPFNIQVGKLKNKTDIKTKFSDVAGMDECKEELIEIVDFLKNPEKYRKAGARVPKGVLLYGPPGSGKTLLARAVAGEANVPFFSASGSEFMEMLVGMGAAKVRELFTKAKTAAPAIVFIDEIDAIGKRRGAGVTGGHQEQEQTLNQILTEMDGFDNNTKVIVIAATNRPDTLDPALLRSGRLDRKILIGKPTLEERVLITKYHLGNKKVDESVNVDAFARRTSGFVGADIENIINEAALKAAKDGREKISNLDIEYGLEKIVMGPEKKIKSIQEKEKKIVAYHELGHAVTAFFLPEADPVEKISIVSRGMALGVTRMMPTEDRYLYSKSKFIDEMTSLLGGRAAEQVFFGEDSVTTGASNDFERVSHIARDMVVKYGMDAEIGLTTYESSKDTGEWTPFKPYSEKTAELIDERVKSLIDNAYLQARGILLAQKEIVDKMATLLLEKEYFTREEFEEMMNAPEGGLDSIIEKIHNEYQKELEALKKK